MITTKRIYRLTLDSIAAIQHLQMVIRCKFPDDSYYDDVLAFDPFADEPQPETEEKIRNMMGDTADTCGLEPDLAWAIRKTGLLVSESGLYLLDEHYRGSRSNRHT
jgi:ketosteroid isomerase-like protein